MEEERDLVTFVSDDGDEIQMEVYDYFEHDGKEYAILMDPEEPAEGEEDAYYVFRIQVNEAEDMEEFLPVAEEDWTDALEEAANACMKCLYCDVEECDGSVCSKE